MGPHYAPMARREGVRVWPLASGPLPGKTLIPCAWKLNQGGVPNGCLIDIRPLLDEGDQMNRNGLGLILCAGALVVSTGFTAGVAGASSAKTQTSVVSGHTKKKPKVKKKPAAPSNVLAVTGQGFTQLQPDEIGDSAASVAAVVKWNSTSEIATDVEVTLTLSNAAGVVVSSDSEDVGAIFPGQSAAVTENPQVSGATSLRVQALVGNTQNLPKGEVSPTLTTTGVVNTPGEFGSTTTGTITSTSTKDLKEVQATAVYLNSAGAIIGGDFTFVDFIPANGSTSFQIQGTSESGIPGLANTVAYGSFSNLTVDGLS
jgi:hypothetical protein